MKKVMFLLATLIIGGMMFSGCKKDTPTPTPTPEPTPTPTTTTVVYKVEKEFENRVMSDCFKLNVTYTNAKGESITETGVVLPWEKSFEVTSPFTAKMEGELVYNENELPGEVIYGKRYGIGYYNKSTLVIDMVGAFSKDDKEDFLEVLQNNPNRLKFSEEKAF